MNVFQPKFAAAGLPTNAKRATYEFFSALFLLLVGSGPKISKRRKTALQPNRTETLKPSKKKKKNVHVILFTRRRA